MKKSVKIIIIVVIILSGLFMAVVYFSSDFDKNSSLSNGTFQEVDKKSSGAVANSSVNISLMPMYGGFEKTADQKKADSEFIEAFVERAGSREEASRGVAGGAREWLEEGDLDTAMKRYNQAWLLNENNPDVYIGFGDILKKRGQEKEAMSMYQKAEELKK